jgi:hypothetical protein
VDSHTHPSCACRRQAVYSAYAFITPINALFGALCCLLFWSTHCEAEHREGACGNILQVRPRAWHKDAYWSPVPYGTDAP